jgi:hypothetical protein
MTRRASEVMKTNSAVRPRKIQTRVLNLEPLEPAVRSVEDAIIRIFET